MNSEAFSVRAALRAGASYLADVVARIVRKFTGVAPLVVALGCESQGHHKPAPPPAPAVTQPAPSRESTEPKPLGQFSITFYYVIGVDEGGA